jgi:hypothetical protein
LASSDSPNVDPAGEAPSAPADDDVLVRWTAAHDQTLISAIAPADDPDRTSLDLEISEPQEPVPAWLVNPTLVPEELVPIGLADRMRRFAQGRFSGGQVAAAVLLAVAAGVLGFIVLTGNSSSPRVSGQPIAIGDHTTTTVGAQETPTPTGVTDTQPASTDPAADPPTDPAAADVGISTAIAAGGPASQPAVISRTTTGTVAPTPAPVNQPPANQPPATPPPTTPPATLPPQTTTIQAATTTTAPAPTTTQPTPTTTRPPRPTTTTAPNTTTTRPHR